MSQRIWRKNAINFQHWHILKFVKYLATHMVKNCNKFPTLFHFNVGKIYRNAYGEKNAIHVQHCFILKLVKYVITHMVKKCNKFPTLAHFKVGEIWRNAYGEKMQ